MKRLIVTADDFGLAPEVNEAVEIAHRTGILTTASLMVGGAAVEDAVARARATPSLRVGLHLVLVEGTPVLPAADLTALTGTNGEFRADMVAEAVDIFFRPAARRQLMNEVEAQFAAYAATRLPLDHVTTHKHFHLHPTIAEAILKVGRRYGLGASRTPLEPRGPLIAVEPDAKLGPAYVTGPWSMLVRARFGRAGVFTPDRVLGLRWSGAMTPQRVRGLVEHLPDGVTELYTHPATRDAFPGACPGYRYADELAALTAPETIAALKASGAVTGGFTDFARAASA